MPREVDLSKYEPTWFNKHYNQYDRHTSWNPEMSEYVKFMYSDHTIQFYPLDEDPETFPANHYEHDTGFKAR